MRRMAQQARIDRIVTSCRGAAQRLGVDRRRIRAAIDSGALPAARLGARGYAIRLDDLDRWLASHLVQPGSHAERRVEQILARESTP